MKNLVLVHGRDQQGKNVDELKQVWTDTFAEGLAKDGKLIPGTLNVVFPYFGDLLDGLVKKMEEQSKFAGVQAKGADTDEGMLRFYYDVFTELSGHAGLSPEDANRFYKGAVQEEGPLNWEWVQAILEVLDDRTSFGAYSIKKWTHDVYVYLTIPAIQRQVNDLVLQQIGTEPCVVVGHSLGSVICYNILKNNKSLDVRSYVSLGSPLGLKSIKALLEKPVEMPSCINGTWYNAYDKRDVVALNPLTKAYFDIDPEITNNADVKNRTKNRHGIEGYLDDKEVAKVIFNSLQ